MTSAAGYALNAIGVLSAALGAILKTAVDVKLQTAAVNVGEEPAGLGWPVVYSTIVALVFFNACEFTNLGDRIKMALNWRSALLIGAFCGLVSGRIIAALQAILK